MCVNNVANLQLLPVFTAHKRSFLYLLHLLRWAPSNAVKYSHAHWFSCSDGYVLLTLRFTKRENMISILTLFIFRLPVPFSHFLSTFLDTQTKCFDWRNNEKQSEPDREAERGKKARMTFTILSGVMIITEWTFHPVGSINGRNNSNRSTSVKWSKNRMLQYRSMFHSA